MLAVLARQVLARVLIAIPMIFALSIVVFVVLRMLPADPLAMMLPPTATPAEVAALRSALGLDRSLPVQYGIWLVHAVHGDLGRSITSGETVTHLIATNLPATIELSVVALAF